MAKRKNSSGGGSCFRSLLCFILAVAVLLAVGLVLWLVVFNDDDDTYSDYDFNQCEPGQVCCNGLENICNATVDPIMFGMVHNAMSARDSGTLVAPNHDNDPFKEGEGALEAGYRGINVDMCNCGGNYVLCHGEDTGCDLFTLDPDQVLGPINRFLDANPNEVVLLTIELNDLAGDQVTLDGLYSALERTDGFVDKLYQHDGSDWPTLQSLIDRNERVLLFYFNGPNGQSSAPPGVHYWFDFAVENAFSYPDLATLEEQTVNGCEITRGSKSTSSFFGINNFVTGKLLGLGSSDFAPKKEAAKTANTLEFAERMVDACTDQNGLSVNVISVDFWRSGDIPELVQRYNSQL